MNKKGAIELSMTTIIIIVIGVTILSLGLVWINDLMGSIGDLSEQALIGGEQQIKEMIGQANEPLNLYTTDVSIEQGEYTQIGVVIYNQEGSEADFTLKAEMGSKSAEKGDVECWVAESEESEESIPGLDSGEKQSRTIVISDEGSSALDMYTCQITLEMGGEQIEKTSISVTVE